MTVAEIIAQLQQMPQDLPVSVNDECGGVFHEDVTFVFRVDADVEHGDRECVILVVNEMED